MGAIFSRWYSRLTRVLFNYNARVRPSIIEYRKRCCGAQETSWMTIRIVVLVIYIFRCLSCCVFIVCYWCELWLMYSDDVIYKQIYLILSKDHLSSIIFYSAAMVRFCCWFLFSSSTSSSLTQIVRISVQLELIDVE